MFVGHVQLKEAAAVIVSSLSRWNNIDGSVEIKVLVLFMCCLSEEVVPNVSVKGLVYIGTYSKLLLFFVSIVM